MNTCTQSVCGFYPTYPSILYLVFQVEDKSLHCSQSAYSLGHGVHAGRTQAMLAVAVLYEQLQHQSYGRRRLGVAMHTQSPSLVVGSANPLFTDAASLASDSSSSAQAQSMPDEASQSPDHYHHPQSMLTDSDLYDLVPLASAEAPEDSASTGSFTPTRSFCLPAVLPSSPMECTSTDAQMESSGQTSQADNHQNDTQGPAFLDSTGSFGGFRPHASVPTLQSSSDRSDAQESSSTKSSASPRSILPALHCPVPKLPLLCITSDAIPNPATGPPVPDTSSPKLQNSSPPISALSPVTTHTPAAYKSPSSNLGKPPQVNHLLSVQFVSLVLLLDAHLVIVYMECL